MNIDIKEFSEMLREYVSDRQKNRPHLTETDIASRIGVARTTFNRIINQQSQPSLKTLVHLYNTVPQVKSFVKKTVTSVNTESKHDPIESDLEELLEDENLFIAYILAFSEHGVTSKELIVSMGKNGQKALQTLINKKLVRKENDNRYRAVDKKKGLVLSFPLIKKHITALMKHYKPDNIGSNYVHYHIESLNKTGLRKIREVQQELHKKVQKIMSKKEHLGDIPIFSIGVCDVIDTQDFKLDEEVSNNENK